ncbi:hypothetical protein [uncultured Methanobrevibacter sp.]|uniref:hypothetical protein n=1 Tax=uncultured Methanobrevibacter sp. TaxID=253161 RepID=UPI0025FDA971|nr:hypothetical protein [uncultured Methanobrevibacter sp.]
MKKLKLGLLAIAVIFLVGASYAVFNANNVVDNSATDIISNTNDLNTNDASPTTITDIPNTVNKDIFSSQDTNLGLNFENSYKKIPETNLQVDAAIDYTDSYVQCPVCGGYIALGEVTKALPQGAICPDACGAEQSTLTEGSFIKYSYDEAYALWEIYGDRQPEVVTDDNTLNNDDITPMNYENDASEVSDITPPETDNVLIVDINQPMDDVHYY